MNIGTIIGAIAFIAFVLCMLAMALAGLGKQGRKHYPEEKMTNEENLTPEQKAWKAEARRWLELTGARAISCGLSGMVFLHKEIPQERGGYFFASITDGYAFWLYTYPGDWKDSLVVADES